MPQDGILSHRSNPHSSEPLSTGSSAVFLTQASPLLCAYSTRTWTPVPCPTPSQLLLTFRFLLRSTPFSQSSMFPKSDPFASHSPLSFLHRNDVCLFWLLQPKAKILIPPTLTSLSYWPSALTTDLWPYRRLRGLQRICHRDNAVSM